MADRISLLQRAADLHKSPQFSAYSKVVIHVDSDTDITVGNDYGRTLEVANPFGTTAMANEMLSKLRGYQYQPYTAASALLDPAAEIGDGVAIKDVYGGLYTRVRNFGRLMAADISAPHDEEINHEFKFVTPQEREVKREFGNVKASLSIQADRITAEVSARTAQGQSLESQLSVLATEITAKVSETGGNHSSFGWSLTSSGHAWYAGNTEVMKVTASGLEVKGKITATSGFIGNGSNGFTISNTAIYNNISSFGGSQSAGVYIGTNGIQLGQGFKVNSSGAVTASSLTVTGGSINIANKFKVDSNGNLTASSGTFEGNVYAKNIKYGGSSGTFSGSGITAGSISYSSGGAMASGWYSGAVGGNQADGAFNSNIQVPYLKAAYLAAMSTFAARAMSLFDGGTYRAASWQSDSIVTGGDVDVGFGSVFQVFDVNGNRQWCGNSLWASFDPSGDGTIRYVGR